MGQQVYLVFSLVLLPKSSYMTEKTDIEVYILGHIVQPT